MTEKRSIVHLGVGDCSKGHYTGILGKRRQGCSMVAGSFKYIMRDEEEITHWAMVFGNREACFDYWRLTVVLHWVVHSV